MGEGSFLRRFKITVRRRLLSWGMTLTPEQCRVLARMRAGTVLERVCPDGNPVVPAYRLGGVPVDAEAIMQLESRGLIQPLMPVVLMQIGYSLYELCPAGAAAV